MSSFFRMSESDAVQLHSFSNFNSFINSHSDTGNGFSNNGSNNEAKKYKLRLKFDGGCALEVVRLNGGHFQNLTHLDISGNSAEKLDLRSLTRLEWLCCSNNQLEVLILSGVSLTYLDCSHNNLQSVVIDPLPNNLSSLQMSFNHLQELPSWTWMIPELFIIYASHNRLRQVDCKFQNCLSQLPIRELHLHSNKIEFVSKDFIQRATRLKILNLSQNLLEHMPNFGRRCGIQELYMSRNRLQDNDEKEALEFLTECTSLRRLHLAFNKIEQINEKCMPAWKNLEELILCGNRLRALPTKMSTLSGLRVLRVHANQLETAPTLSKMPNLKVVDLSHNNLRKINLDNLISGGNLTYLDISCNERLTLNPEKLHSPRRPMNLVEVTNARRPMILDMKNNQSRDFPVNPPWELGFSELPDRHQSLSVTQYRDINLSNGREALFGLFDGGDKNTAPKAITKSIAKLYAEERNIEDSPRFSLKYTLLNSLRNLRQQGNTKPMQGILCLLSMQEDNLLHDKPSFTLNLAMVGGIRCVLIETGKKITRLTDSNDRDENYNPDCENQPNPLSKSSSENDLSNNTNNKNRSNSDVSIPDPVVVSLPLTTSSEYLVIANQSVWNHVSDKELVDELETHRHKKSVLIAKRLTDMAQSHSCKQSLSLLLVRFKWHSSASRGLILDSSSKKVGMGEYGPLSYYSGSSDYSDDVTNPLASVTTPDSAIETDRSSGNGSIGDNDSNSRKSNNSSNGRRRIKTITTEESIPGSGNNDDMVSIANTSVSQMSVEQFRCWEYMLEQNTRLLFKKELDTLSKAKNGFQRNQKLRKSVHFPYSQEEPLPASVSSAAQTGSGGSTKKAPLASSKSTNPGFYTLSKAKSLTQLFGPEHAKHTSGQAPPPAPTMVQNGSVNSRTKPKPQFPLFTNANAGFLESVRSTRPNTRGTILGGPNAAYFGSAQRLVQPVHVHSTPSVLYEADEIQEVRSIESVVDHDTRLKKYWDNKITEL